MSRNGLIVAIAIVWHEASASPIQCGDRGLKSRCVYKDVSLGAYRSQLMEQAALRAEFPYDYVRYPPQSRHCGWLENDPIADIQPTLPRQILRLYSDQSQHSEVLHEEYRTCACRLITRIHARAGRSKDLQERKRAFYEMPSRSGCQAGPVSRFKGSLYQV